MIKQLTFLLKVSRPVTWPVGYLLLLTGFLVAGGSADAYALSYFAIFTMLFAFVIFGLNDAHDYETDRFSRRKGFLEGALVPKGMHGLVAKSAIAAALLLLAVTAAVNFSSLGATFLGIFFAYAYSVPPLRLKEKPLLDSLSNIPIVLAFLLAGFFFGMPLAEFPPKLLFASLGAAGIHALAAIVDYHNDRKAKINTIATKFGIRFAAIFSLLITTAIIAFSGVKSLPLNVFLWLMLAVFAAIAMKPAPRLARALGKWSLAAFVAAMIAFLYQQFYK